MLSGYKDGGTLTANLTDRIAVPMKTVQAEEAPSTLEHCLGEA